MDERVLRRIGSRSPELDNLRTALDWAVESKQFDAGAELLGSAGIFFDLIGIRSEGLARCQQLLAVELAPLRRADVFYWASSYTRASDPAGLAELRVGTDRAGATHSAMTGSSLAA